MCMQMLMQESSATNVPEISLVAHMLRFTIKAETTIKFHDFAGSALRGALAQQLRRTFCPEWRSSDTDPLHRSLCPICQILSWEGSGTTPGEIRRPYALQPPLPSPTICEAGEELSFGITIFGDKLAFLPYFILAIQAMGAQGVGKRNTHGQRGIFQLDVVDSVHPFSGETFTMLAPGARSVQTQTIPITHAHVTRQAAILSHTLQEQQNRLSVHWLTPVRLTQGRNLLQSPYFFPFMKQIVLRVLDLSAQHGGGRPDVVLRRDIYPHADQVELVEDQTRWWDLKGYSQRLEQRQVMGGLIGSATYRAPDWSDLLPWLLWGQVVQVGKNIVKGCGHFRLYVDSL